MSTSPGVCNDALGANGQYLLERKADPLMIEFIENILDIKKLDLAVLSGDQLHYNNFDSLTPIYKLFASFIKRSIPYAPVFGNHDSEGIYALLHG